MIRRLCYALFDISFAVIVGAILVAVLELVR